MRCWMYRIAVLLKLLWTDGYTGGGEAIHGRSDHEVASSELPLCYGSCDVRSAFVEAYT